MDKLKVGVIGGTGMVGMHVRGNESDGSGSDPGNYPVQPGYSGPGVNKEGGILTFNYIDCFIGHQVAIALPSMVVNLTDYDVVVAEHDLLGVTYFLPGLGTRREKTAKRKKQNCNWFFHFIVINFDKYNNIPMKKNIWLKLCAIIVAVFGITSCGSARKAAESARTPVEEPAESDADVQPEDSGNIKEESEEYPAVDQRVRVMYGVPPAMYRNIEKEAE